MKKKATFKQYILFPSLYPELKQLIFEFETFDELVLKLKEAQLLLETEVLCQWDHENLMKINKNKRRELLGFVYHFDLTKYLPHYTECEYIKT